MQSMKCGFCGTRHYDLEKYAECCLYRVDGVAMGRPVQPAVSSCVSSLVNSQEFHPRFICSGCGKDCYTFHEAKECCKKSYL